MDMSKKSIIVFITAIVVCSSMALGVDSADLTGDANVNMKDYAVLAENYLKCTDPNNMACAEDWGFVSIGIVYGDYEWLRYEPNSRWDLLSTLINTSRADKLNIEDIAAWSGQLNKYNILLFTNLYDYGSSVNVSTYAAQIKSWLQSNRSILIIEGAGMSGIGWLDDVNASWTVSANDRLAGLPQWIDPNLLQAHSMPDGWPADGARARAIPNPSVTDFANGGLNVPATGSVLVRNKLSRPTVWADSLGKGKVIVTSYFSGYGLNELVFENFVKYCWNSYEKSVVEPNTIAERVALVDTITQTSPNVITLDSNGVMRIGTAPYFPWGFYSITRSSSLARMDSNGFNYSNNWHATLPTYTNIKAQKSLTFEMEVWDTNPVTIRSEMITDVVKPSFVCWCELEEFSNNGFYIDKYGGEQSVSLDNQWVKYRTDVTHKLDPKRPVSVLCNSPPDFEIYGPITDFATVGPFCITSSTSNIDKVAIDVNDMRQITGKPVWALLQAGGVTSKGLIPPTVDQLKSEFYAALSGGAKGVFWYAFEGTSTDITYLRNSAGVYLQPQWSGLTSLSTEYATIKPYLFAQSYDVTVVSPSAGAYARRWVKAGAPENLLVIANTRAIQQTITISWPLATQNYTALFGSPALTFPTGQISVTLNGYKVGVYKFTN
jgi:hypothetical protein